MRFIHFMKTAMLGIWNVSYLLLAIKSFLAFFHLLVKVPLQKFYLTLKQQLLYSCLMLAVRILTLVQVGLVQMSLSECDTLITNNNLASQLMIVVIALIQQFCTLFLSKNQSSNRLGVHHIVHQNDKFAVSCTNLNQITRVVKDT